MRSPADSEIGVDEELGRSVHSSQAARRAQRKRVEANIFRPKLGNRQGVGPSETAYVTRALIGARSGHWSPHRDPGRGRTWAHYRHQWRAALPDAPESIGCRSTDTTGETHGTPVHGISCRPSSCRAQSRDERAGAGCGTLLVR